jgi:DNA topoisomerase I
MRHLIEESSRKTRQAAPVVDPVDAARGAGLVYVTDAGPGIGRKRAGKAFRYEDPEGRPLRDEESLGRIRALAIPPAWTEVWICPSPRGHIQATGRDAKGRKQYRYHPRWRAARDETKYTRTIAFAGALGPLRRRLGRDLALPGLPRPKVLAAVVRLLETTLIRVGNAEYARRNRSFGLTTLHDRHVAVSGGTARFSFRGKGGIRHTVGLNDRRLAAIIKKCQELPGQELFQYVDDDGDVRDVGSSDVNAYLYEATGRDFTAKDFRTWAGTVLASLALREFEAFDSQAQAKKNIVRAIEGVAERLGNTPTVCRKCYIHPAVIDSYLEGSLLDTLRRRAESMAEGLRDLRPEEAAVLTLLRQRLARERARDRAKEKEGRAKQKGTLRPARRKGGRGPVQASAR